MRRTLRDTLLIAAAEAGLLYLASALWLTHIGYTDMLFFGGVALFAVSYIFSGRSHFLRRHTNMRISGQTGMLLEDEDAAGKNAPARTAFPPFLLAPAALAVIGLIASIVRYRQYF